MKRLILGGIAAFCVVLASCSSSSSPSLPTQVPTRATTNPTAKQRLHIVVPKSSLRHRLDATGALADGGFESGGFSTWVQCGSVNATITTSTVHSGNYADLNGSPTADEPNGYAGVCQDVTVPTNGKLTFWINESTNDNVSYADQEADLLDSSGYALTTLYSEAANTNGWVSRTYDVSAYAGQTVTLFFGVYGSGSAGYTVAQYVDDVAWAGASPTPKPTSGPTATPKPTSGPTATPKPTSGPTATPKPTSGPTATPNPTATPVPTPVPTIAPTPGNGQPTPFPTPAGSGPQGTSCGTSCGVQRWHIKTLDDGDEGLINWLPTLASVSQMAAIPVPSGYQQYNDTTRYAPTETQVYTVRAVLTVWKEESDHDFHIVLVDPNNSSATMIGEMPDPGCSAACDSGFAQIFGNNRSQFQTCFGTASTSFMNLPSGVVADVTGVPLFDALHGQTGVAPNGIELHPILSVHFISGC